MDLWHESAAVALNFRFVPGRTPLADWDVALGASVFYVILVYGLRQLLKDSPRFESKLLSLVHNAAMFLISLACFLGLSYGIYLAYISVPDGPEVLFCDHANVQSQVGVLRFWLYIFWLSKIYEFLDTVIIVLRKGNLIFLHVYHHWITNILCFWTLYYELPDGWTACVLNAFVHIPMYLYYLLSILGFKDIWFKRYITQIQITQFVSVISMHSYSFYMHYEVKHNCHSFDVWWKNAFGMAVIVSYLLLFLKFYADSYRNRASQRSRPKSD